MDYQPRWGVDIERVAALTPHITISEDAYPAPVDPLYADAGIRKITRTQVDQWINDVDARVSGRLWRLDTLPLEHPAIPGLEGMAADAVANGAASYLVDAAFPAKAAPNDNTSYGAVLRARMLEALADIEARLEALLGPIVVATPADAPAAVELSFEFPPPTFVDNFRY